MNNRNDQNIDERLKEIGYGITNPRLKPLERGVPEYQNYDLKDLAAGSSTHFTCIAFSPTKITWIMARQFAFAQRNTRVPPSDEAFSAPMA